MVKNCQLIGRGLYVINVALEYVLRVYVNIKDSIHQEDLCAANVLLAR